MFIFLYMQSAYLLPINTRVSLFIHPHAPPKKKIHFQNDLPCLWGMLANMHIYAQKYPHFATLNAWASGGRTQDSYGMLIRWAVNVHWMLTIGDFSEFSSSYSSGSPLECILPVSERGHTSAVCLPFDAKLGCCTCMSFPHAYYTFWVVNDITNIANPVGTKYYKSWKRKLWVTICAR